MTRIGPPGPSLLRSGGTGTVTDAEPATPLKVAVIEAVPEFTGVARPVLLIVATLLLLVDHEAPRLTSKVVPSE